MSSDDVFKTSSRHLDQDEFVLLSHASSRRLAKMPSGRLQNALQMCLQDVFKTSSRRLEDVLKTS